MRKNKMIKIMMVNRNSRLRMGCMRKESLFNVWEVTRAVTLVAKSMWLNLMSMESKTS